MDNNDPKPLQCPVCGSTELRLTTSPKLILGTPPKIVSYRCAQGHVFVVAQKADSAASGE